VDTAGRRLRHRRRGDDHCDGLMFATGSENRAFALDLLTGRPVWRYSKKVPKGVQGCCGSVNRGFAALGDRPGGGVDRLYLQAMVHHVTGEAAHDSHIPYDDEEAFMDDEDYRIG
jgi:hypothetical protein